LVISWKTTQTSNLKFLGVTFVNLYDPLSRRGQVVIIQINPGQTVWEYLLTLNGWIKKTIKMVPSESVPMNCQLCQRNRQTNLILTWPFIPLPSIACFVAQICHLLSGKWKIVVTSKHEHWLPFIVHSLNSNCGLTFAWILTMEGRFRRHECSCYDVTPRDGTECRVLMPF
jgi:hypothetical protein